MSQENGYTAAMAHTSPAKSIDSDTDRNHNANLSNETLPQLSVIYDNPDQQRLYAKADVSHDAEINDSTVKFPIESLETRVSVSLNMSNAAIQDVFRKVADEKGYMIIEEDQQQLTAVREKFGNWKAMFTKCIPFVKSSQNNMVAMRLKIAPNPNNYNKSIIIKGLCGDRKDFLTFTEEFKEAINGQDKKGLNGDLDANQSLVGGPFGMQDPSFIPIQNSKYLKMKETMAIREEQEEGSQMQSNLETHSIYYFNKILSNDAYTLGKKVSAFLEKFAETHQSIETCAKTLPRPMEIVINNSNETVETLFQEFNFGRSETRKIMPYCKFAVEKYIFEKLYTPLYGMYLHRTNEIAMELLAKKEKLADVSLDAILTSLDIKKKWWLMKNEHANELGSKRLGELKDSEVPYSTAINELDKLEKLWNPREKLNSLLMMQSLMRSSVVEFYHGKEELSCLDDELPIVVFIVLMTHNRNFPADLQFIEHYISFEPDSDYEARLLTNLRVSIQFICKEWNIDSLLTVTNGNGDH